MNTSGLGKGELSFLLRGGVLFYIPSFVITAVSFTLYLLDCNCERGHYRNGFNKIVRWDFDPLFTLFWTANELMEKWQERQKWHLLLVTLTYKTLSINGCFMCFPLSINCCFMSFPYILYWIVVDLVVSAWALFF